MHDQHATSGVYRRVTPATCRWEDLCMRWLLNDPDAALLMSAAAILLALVALARPNRARR
jgi:hypothetical protein